MSSADSSKNPRDVAAMFDEVAPAYDRMNLVLSLGMSALWRRATVNALHLRAGDRVLDIAAGTGTSSAALARTGARVTALDFSAGMVEVGKKTHDHITFVVGDALALPFPDACFDAVTVSFGLRNMVDPHVALAEMRRVLVPGGRLVICEFSTPPVALIRAAYFLYLTVIMPRIARWVSTNPGAYDYLRESIRDWPVQGVLAQWIREAGFTEVGYRNLSWGAVALHRGVTPSGGRS